jgi:hypothetical protein
MENLRAFILTELAAVVYVTSLQAGKQSHSTFLKVSVEKNRKNKHKH